MYLGPCFQQNLVMPCDTAHMLTVTNPSPWRETCQLIFEFWLPSSLIGQQGLRMPPHQVVLNFQWEFQGLKMELGYILGHHLCGWWLSHPSEKYEFVSWDDEIPNIWKNKIHVPNQQPDQVNCCIEVRARYQSGWFRQIIEISPPPSLEKKGKNTSLAGVTIPQKWFVQKSWDNLQPEKMGNMSNFGKTRGLTHPQPWFIIHICRWQPAGNLHIWLEKRITLILWYFS